MAVATYNILNVKDRYEEREGLMKQSLYELGAEIVGLQEVVFGPGQLDELTSKNGPRHKVDRGCDSYEAYEAPCQMEIFTFNNHPDKNAKIDGNAILVSPSSPHKVLSHSYLAIGGTRNCQCVKVQLSGERLLYFVNCHLHHVAEEEEIREH